MTCSLFLVRRKSSSKTLVLTLRAMSDGLDSQSWFHLLHTLLTKSFMHEGWRVSRETVNVLLAAISAPSLPWIPIWDGIRMKSIRLFYYYLNNYIVNNYISMSRYIRKGFKRFCEEVEIQFRRKVSVYNLLIKNWI